MLGGGSGARLTPVAAVSDAEEVRKTRHVKDLSQRLAGAHYGQLPTLLADTLESGYQGTKPCGIEIVYLLQVDNEVAVALTDELFELVRQHLAGHMVEVSSDTESRDCFVVGDIDVDPVIGSVTPAGDPCDHSDERGSCRHEQRPEPEFAEAGIRISPKAHQGEADTAD